MMRDSSGSNRRLCRGVVGRASDILNKDRRRVDEGFRELAEKD